MKALGLCAVIIIIFWPSTAFAQVDPDLLKKAEQGDALAQFNLGVNYQMGVGGVQQNESKAFEWYLKAAENGEPEACQTLGFLYENGLGVAKDETKAAEWYRKALELYLEFAEQGMLLAQTGLAFMYKYGRGVTKDEAEVEKWLQRAAEQGDMFSQVQLLNIYEKRGMSKDNIAAKRLQWHQKAAMEKGNARAQSALGDMYYLGEGVKQDYFTAAFWYQKAVEQGYSDAEYGLGFMHVKGQGVVRDIQKACNLFRASAEQGHREAIEAYNKVCAK